MAATAIPLKPTDGLNGAPRGLLLPDLASLELQILRCAQDDNFWGLEVRWLANIAEDAGSSARAARSAQDDNICIEMAFIAIPLKPTDGLNGAPRGLLLPGLASLELQILRCAQDDNFWRLEVRWLASIAEDAGPSTSPSASVRDDERRFAG
jgi:hypothetical protein